MAVKECIILAGGLGTRLRSAVADLPKCMAPVAGKPFLHWVIQHLKSFGVSSFIFSLGYMHEKIEAYISEEYPDSQTKFIIEEEPLGTGGAIFSALKNCTQENVLVVNGDTLYKADIENLFTNHLKYNSECTLALKPMENFDRYGSVEISNANRIMAFNEKTFVSSGLINGGTYIINRNKIFENDFPAKFSFEKEYLEQYFSSNNMIGIVDDGYFIDIGIPEDFLKANQEIK